MFFWLLLLPIWAAAAGMLGLLGEGSLGLLKPVAFPGRLERRQQAGLGLSWTVLSG